MNPVHSAFELFGRQGEFESLGERIVGRFGASGVRQRGAPLADSMRSLRAGEDRLGARSRRFGRGRRRIPSPEESISSSIMAVPG